MNKKDQEIYKKLKDRAQDRRGWQLCIPGPVEGQRTRRRRTYTSAPPWPTALLCLQAEVTLAKRHWQPPHMTRHSQKHTRSSTPSQWLVLILPTNEGWKAESTQVAWLWLGGLLTYAVTHPATQWDRTERCWSRSMPYDCTTSVLCQLYLISLFHNIAVSMLLCHIFDNEFVYFFNIFEYILFNMYEHCFRMRMQCAVVYGQMLWLQ